MTVRIVTDSTADLPPDVVRSLGITIVPLNLHFGQETFRDGIDIDSPAFYRRLTSDQVHPTTSQPAPGVFAETYQTLAQDAEAIVSIHISSKLSGTHNSALLGVQEAKLDIPVDVLDSRTVSLAFGLVVTKAARVALEGGSREEVMQIARNAIESARVLLVLDTLEYVRRGGRIGKARALLGTLIQVKPLLTVRDGEIHPARQVRTRSKALDALVEWTMQQEPIEAIGVGYSTGEEDANLLVSRLRSALQSSERRELLISQIGPVLGVYAGPGCLGVAVLSK